MEGAGRFFFKQDHKSMSQSKKKHSVNNVDYLLIEAERRIYASIH